MFLKILSTIINCMHKEQKSVLKKNVIAAMFYIL